MTTTSTLTAGEPLPTTAGGSRLRRLTRIAGLLYLAIFVVYPLATAARSSLVVAGDAAATVDNIVANEALFRWGMAGEATIFLVEIVLAGVLYVILRPVSRSGSLAAAFARVAEGVVMAAGNVVMGILTLVAIGGAGSLMAFDPGQREALALLFQEANGDIVLLWGFFFGLSLVLTGWLVATSGFVPRIPGMLLVLAGVGYLAQSFGTFVAPGLSDVLATVVLVLAIPGELVFAGWLLVKGVDEDAWHARASQAASTHL